MAFRTYYIAFLRKGPTWVPGGTPELEELQERHLAHLRSLAEAGQLAAAGPTDDHCDGTLRGICIFDAASVTGLDQVRELVEADPMIQVGRLRADYATWHTIAQVE